MKHKPGTWWLVIEIEIKTWNNYGEDNAWKISAVLLRFGVIIRPNRTGIPNLNWLFIQEMKSSEATVGFWKGFQARSLIYIWKGLGLSSQKQYIHLDKVLTLYNTLLLPFPIPMDIVIWKKKIVIKTSISLRVQIENKTVWNDYYNIEGNAFLSIDFLASQNQIVHVC